MARRLQQLDPLSLSQAWELWRASEDKVAGRELVKHYLAVLEAVAPGSSVEVRVPPYAAVQVVPGVRHTRGTPPAVVEMSTQTWLDLASGSLTWDDAVEQGLVRASGERGDLAPYLPL